MKWGGIDYNLSKYSIAFFGKVGFHCYWITHQIPKKAHQIFLFWRFKSKVMWRLGRSWLPSVAFNKIKVTSLYRLSCLKMFFFPTHDTPLALDCVLRLWKGLFALSYMGKITFLIQHFKIMFFMINTPIAKS